MATNCSDKYVDYLKPFPESWKRPDGPLRVWRVFEGHKRATDGEIPKFSIQEVPEELYEDVVDFMEKHFIHEESISVNKNLPEDPIGVREFRTVWRSTLDEGLSVVALKVNSDPNAKPVIAGVNILSVMTPEIEASMKDMTDFKSEIIKNLMAVMNVMTRNSDTWGKFGVDKFLSALGLSVHPDFRRMGLAEELLRTRDDIGRAYQIPVSQTVFTGVGSQIAAARAGFEVIYQKKYSEILDSDGKLMFPGIPVEYLKIMAKKLY